MILITALGVVFRAPAALATNWQCTGELNLTSFRTWACAEWYGGSDGHWHVDSVEVWKDLYPDQSTSTVPPFWSDVQFTPGSPTYYVYMGKSENGPGTAQLAGAYLNRTVSTSRELRFSVQTYTPDGVYKCTAYFWIAMRATSYRHAGCVVA